MTLDNKYNRKKITRTVYFTAIGAFFLFIGIRMVNGFKETSETLKEELPPIYTISAQDSNIIAPQYRKLLKIKQVRRSKLRNDVAILSLGDNYTIVVQKFKTETDVPLTKVVHTEKISVDRTTMVAYSVLPFSNYTYMKMARSNVLTSNYFLTLSGDSIKTLQASDSLVAYSINAKNVSLRFGYEHPVDTYIVAKESIFKSTLVPINLMLLKRNGFVYFVTLTAQHDNKLPNQDIILKVIE